MVFSSPTFLFLFLPLVLAFVFLAGRRLRNPALLAASLFFYAWGERGIVLVMVVSIVANWGFGLWVAAAKRRGGGRAAVAAAVIFDLGLLIVFKYANWLWQVASDGFVALGGSRPAPLGEALGPTMLALGWIDGPLPPDWAIHLPIGISFFTFQALSYVVDVYRGEGEAQRNPFTFGVYISLFPQLIAGPIVRYKDVAAQLVNRTVDVQGFAWGVRRFLVGLGKKMLIANTAAHTADQIFGLPDAELTSSGAWLGLICYSLQIYFDFSGYSDMAIGLGRMLGFRFLENFRYPYVAQSITDFWRRWHISLSNWFRDYLYVPLGGSREGAWRTYRNLLIVFVLCGLWHGASSVFLIWGLYHGAFLILERAGLREMLERAPRPVRHLYLLLVVLVGWVFFRAEGLPEALAYLRALAGFAVETRGGFFDAAHYLDPRLMLVLVLGLVGCTPWLEYAVRWREGHRGLLAGGLELAGHLALALVFLLSSMKLASGSYDPFIYFRF